MKVSVITKKSKRMPSHLCVFWSIDCVDCKKRNTNLVRDRHPVRAVFDVHTFRVLGAEAVLLAVGADGADTRHRLGEVRVDGRAQYGLETLGELWCISVSTRRISGERTFTSRALAR